MTEPKFETVKEFLKRGGTITKVPSGPVPPQSEWLAGNTPKRHHDVVDWEEESRFQRQPNVKLINYFNRRKR